ncbi:GDSL-type esterase/lipase family protein [Streptomyces katrae]|uniref:GDSL-type esterase/lipase family protein n=1 Tax=Streptomyces katrae TaxID=68223 RepID=A0ABT7GVJ1_9ACTN|nr:GDSL-type esterase/lipase family protein [Streptomyces katrae]MDK9497645.1 GDSL-type esterase/lipase family protein [Streptomyces katrae]
MTITIRPGSTVMFTGDSITDCQRLESEDGLGFGYPFRVAGEWGLRHPDRHVTWLNTGISGHKVMDLEARWRTDVLDARPDLVSILVGVNDMGWHTIDPAGRVIPTEEFEAGYDRLLAPLAEAGTELILIEPFLLPIRGVVEAGAARIGEEVRKQWRTDLDPKIQAVRGLAHRYGAQLIAADGMFAELSTTTGPEYWAADGVHPTPAGHAALAAAWLRLVA